VALLALPATIYIQSCQSASPQEVLREYLRTSIEDAERSAKLVVLAERLQSASLELLADAKAKNAELWQVHCRHEATTSDLKQVFDRWNQVRDLHRGEILATLAEMRLHSRPEEWAEISSLQAEALENAIQQVHRPAN
jgi:hypothetical protein